MATGRRVYECGLRDRMIIPLPSSLHCFISSLNTADAIYFSCLRRAIRCIIF